MKTITTLNHIVVLDYVDLSKKDRRRHDRYICRLNRRTQLYRVRKFIASLFKSK